MTIERGPIETALSSPGFTLFWNRVMADLVDLHGNLAAESEKLITEGNGPKALSTLTRAAQVRDIIEKIKDAPTKAKSREKEKLHGRPDESRHAGYSDSV